MERYRVFLSSPVDVLIERDRAELVIKRINGERVDHKQLEIVRWEHEFYRAEADFQAQLPKPADCDLVVCLFWKRLGSELPERYARPDGTIPTGTEYEFESALQAAAGRHEKLPDVLVYRKTADVTFAAETLEIERAQYERFMDFWHRWFRNEKGHFVAGFQTFVQPDDFEVLLERHLRAWLREREEHIEWDKGSPYRGLEPFNVEHAPIFFGRRREVERARARLISSAMSGKPFLLITGASGSGKSSLARAGLIPRLSQVGGLSTLGAAIRWCILTPGQIADGWARGLAEALLEKNVLGRELALGDFATAEELATQLARGDASSTVPVTRALDRMADAIAMAEQRATRPNVVLLILLDQLEELFAWGRTDAAAFLALLRALCEAPGSRIWIVATMRSDFQHRLTELAGLEHLAGRIEIKGPGEAERTLELALPTTADLREMIIHPARAAGLTFETSADGRRDLAHLIEAEARPEAMPAIQFLLNELYQRRRGSLLTLEAFDALRGVGGVMAQRGEEIYYSIDAPARQAFPRVVRALVTQVRADVPASTRRVAASAFADDRPAGRLLGALNDARIVISDHGEMRFAHDSVLIGWKRLKDQISEEQRLFEARDRLEQLCRRWIEGDKGAARPGRLLLQGFPLAEGRELLARWGADGLRDKQPELPDFISASDRREKRARRITLAIGWSVASVLAVMSWQLYDRWIAAENARRDAQAALWIANSRTELRDNRIRAAVDNAAKAFQERPSEVSRSALAAAMLEVSPHLRSTFEVGPLAGEAMAWSSAEEVTYASAEAGGRLRTLAPLERRPSEIAAGLELPRLTREQDGNRAAARVLRRLGADRLVVVLDDGTHAVVERGAAAPRLVRPPQPMTLYHTPHSAVIGRTGVLAATASIDGDVAVIECTPQMSDCRRRALDDVRGKVVAISPDETRVAVGSEDGSVRILDRAGRQIAGPATITGTLLSLDWSGVRDLLAVGTAEGEIAILDASTPALPVLAKTSVPGAPATTVAWSARRVDLAFACGGRAVCVWPLAIKPDGGLSEAPVRRMDGHTNAVTRLAWSPSGEHIASVAGDGTIRVWSEVQDRDAGYALYAETASAHTIVATSPDGKWLAAGDKDGTVRIWDLATAAVQRHEPFAAGAEIVALSWSRSGQVAAASEHGRVAVIPVDPQQPVRTLAIETGLNARLAWAQNDASIVIPQQQDKRIALIDATGSALRISRNLDPIGGEATPWGVAVDPTGNGLLVTYADAQGDVRLWDLAQGKPVAAMAYTLEQPRDPVAAGSLSISPDGRLLAISGGDSFVRLYDIPARRSWRALQIEANEPHAVAFSPDGTRLAALGADSQLTIWSVHGDKTERFAAMRSTPARAALADVESSRGNARWLAWVGSDAIAITSETAQVSIIGLDATRWRRRIDMIAPVAAPAVR